MKSVIEFFKSAAGKVVFWVVVGFTIVALVLRFLAKDNALKAKEMNLGALIQDAIDQLKIKQRKEKIEELDKPVKTETDPDKVEEFYKNRK